MNNTFQIKSFLDSLAASPKTPSIVNPWWETDPGVDETATAAAIRRHQLEAYLAPRIGKARTLLVAEALGYQGGRFTGIPMTSERILLGHLVQKGLTPEMALGSQAAQRTSLESLRPTGFTEPTATIVWQTVLATSHPPEEFVFWNAFPWHPIHPEKGPLSNRTPTTTELKQGLPVLQQFLALFPEAQVLALGRKASFLLESLEVPHKCIRHPARGGASLFREQLTNLLGGENTPP